MLMDARSKIITVGLGISSGELSFMSAASIVLFFCKSMTD